MRCVVSKALESEARAPLVSKSVACVLWNHLFYVYGFQACRHSDQGVRFESSLIAELFLLAGVEKSHTTLYQPKVNGQTERMNHILGNMIWEFPPRSKASLTFAYNCTVHESTGLPPFFWMYGHTPRLPVCHVETCSAGWGFSTCTHIHWFFVEGWHNLQGYVCATCHRPDRNINIMFFNHFSNCMLCKETLECTI